MVYFNYGKIFLSIKSNTLFCLLSDDHMCPVKTFMMYKKHRNPQCQAFVQRPKKCWEIILEYGTTKCHLVTILWVIWWSKLVKRQGYQGDILTIPWEQRQSVSLIRHSLQVGISWQSQDIKQNQVSKLIQVSLKYSCYVKKHLIFDVIELYIFNVKLDCRYGEKRINIYGKITKSK